jgi:uncharacterized protein YndB with AHSA1/START domain
MSSMTVRRRVAASPPEVFRALLDPAAIAAWRVPDGMTSVVHDFDAREGGSYRISLTYDDPARDGKSAGRTDTFRGRIIQLVPGELVVEVVEFETADPALRGPMTLTTALTAAGGGTEVAITYDRIPPGVAPADNELGTRMSLDKLAAWVEAQRGDAAPRR